MPELLLWPDDFNDPKLLSDFRPDFVELLERLIASGAMVQADPSWMLLRFSRASRCVNFILRGRTRGRNGAIRESYWEVLPSSDGQNYRLGPLFGIRDYACVVVAGTMDVTLIATRWLDGDSLAATMEGIDSWDRADLSSPLKAPI